MSTVYGCRFSEINGGCHYASVTAQHTSLDKESTTQYYSLFTKRSPRNVPTTAAAAVSVTVRTNEVIVSGGSGAPSEAASLNIFTPVLVYGGYLPRNSSQR